MILHTAWSPLPSFLTLDECQVWMDKAFLLGVAWGSALTALLAGLIIISIYRNLRHELALMHKGGFACGPSPSTPSSTSPSSPPSSSPST